MLCCTSLLCIMFAWLCLMLSFSNILQVWERWIFLLLILLVISVLSSFPLLVARDNLQWWFEQLKREKWGEREREREWWGYACAAWSFKISVQNKKKMVQSCRLWMELRPGLQCQMKLQFWFTPFHFIPIVLSQRHSTKDLIFDLLWLVYWCLDPYSPTKILYSTKRRAFGTIHSLRGMSASTKIVELPSAYPITSPTNKRMNQELPHPDITRKWSTIPVTVIFTNYFGVAAHWSWFSLSNCVCGFPHPPNLIQHVSVSTEATKTSLKLPLSILILLSPNLRWWFLCDIFEILQNYSISFWRGKRFFAVELKQYEAIVCKCCEIKSQ